MRRGLTIWLLSVFWLCGLTFVARGQEAAATPRARGVVRVAKVAGEVNVTDIASTLKTRVTTSNLIVDGQIVETGPKAYVVLVFSNGAIVMVKENSRLEVNQFLQNPFGQNFSVREATHEPSISTTRLNLRKGEIVSQVKKLDRDAGSSFTVETPVGAAGIRGTSFRLLFVPAGRLARFSLSMAEGLIRFVPGRGRMVEVPGGKEISFLVNLDASGRVMNIPEITQPTDVASGDQADLQKDLSEAIAAALPITFAAATGNGTGNTGGQFSTGAAITTDNPVFPTTAEQTATPAPNTSTGGNALGSPAPVGSPQRTTPGDGS